MNVHIIMPIGADPNYQNKINAIEASASNLGISIRFPNYCQVNPHFDLKLTLQELELSNFILADLSQERPSCYYELGLAQAIGKKVHIIATEGTVIHQAYNRDQVHFYKNVKELQLLVRKIIILELKK